MTTSPADRKLAEDLAAHAFGTTVATRQFAKMSPVPVAYINDAMKVIARPEIVNALLRWTKEDRRRDAQHRPGGETPGWKPAVSIITFLILMLIHVQDGRALTFSELAKTLVYRMGPKQFNAIGITKTEGTHEQWMNRLFGAKDRLERMIDPLPGNRKVMPTSEEYLAIVADREERADELAIKGERLHWFMNQLVESSVQLLRRDILDRYQGNIALDATKMAMFGSSGVSRATLRALMSGDLEHAAVLADADEEAKEHAERELDRQAEAKGEPVKVRARRNKWKHAIRTINYDCGFWGRGGDQGSHDGEDQGATDRAWALEFEVAIMTANNPNETADFPLLALGIHHHRPGVDVGEAKRVLESIAARNYPRRMLLVDRGYLPKALPEDLQGPARDMGWEPVFDYKVDQLGKMDNYDDVILADGQWYLSCIPDEQANAEQIYRAAIKADGKLSKPKRMSDKQRAQLREIRDERRRLREAYRLKAKGKPFPDGSQRFSYPHPDTYYAFDPNTGEELSKQTKSTIHIPRDAGLKYRQKFVHLGKKWQDWFGLRNTVESYNKYLKDQSPIDMQDASKRQARGNTFAALVATLIVVVANIRKIDGFILGLTHDGETTSKNRHEVVSPFDDNQLDVDAINAVAAAVSALEYDPGPE